MPRKASMTFLDHLGELRKRLLRTFLVLLATSGVGLALAERLLDILLKPYGSVLVVIGPTESVSAYIRVALVVGIGASLPYAIAELWGFVRPALQPKERRYVYGILPAALVLFLLGAAFAWFGLIPAAVRFLTGVGPRVFRTQWTADKYIPFVTSLVAWIGVSFELPVLVFVLAKLRILTARALAKAWRVGVVGVLLASAVITPTVDPFNMLLVSAPLDGLYGVSIAVAALVGRGQSRLDAAGAGSMPRPGL